MPDTQPLQRIIDRVDRMVQDELGDTNQAFNLGRSRLYGIDCNGSAHLVGEHEDPYIALVLHDRPDNAVAAVLVVTAWAAPTNEGGNIDCPPSQHPDKVRARITVAVSDEGIVSSLRRMDAPDEVTFMHERGTGALPDALECWWSLD